jgi:hypothetical protein
MVLLSRLWWRQNDLELQVKVLCSFFPVCVCLTTFTGQEQQRRQHPVPDWCRDLLRNCGLEQ